MNSINPGKDLIVPSGKAELQLRSNGLVIRGLRDLSRPTSEEESSLASFGDIFTAVQAGEIGKVRAILAMDPTSVSKRDEQNDWRTPLHYAAEHGHVSIVEILLQYGAEIDAGTGEVAEYTMKSGEKHTWRDPGKTPLLLACFEHQTAAAKLLVQKGSNVNEADSLGYTPLHAAAVRGDLELVELLLLRGAKVDVKARCVTFSEEFGWESDSTALHIAARNGYAAIAELLLLNGADVNLGDRAKRTPLMFAARMGHTQATKILLSHGARANIMAQEDDGQNHRPGTGMTALHYAAEGGHEETVKLLVEYKEQDEEIEWFCATGNHLKFKNSQESTVHKKEWPTHDVYGVGSEPDSDEEIIQEDKYEDDPLAMVDFLSFVVTKDEVDSGNLNQILGALERLLTDPKTAAKFCDRVNVLFHGYDSDPRELWEISEVRRFVERLDSKFPYWLYFLSKKRAGLQCLAFCLLPTSKVSTGTVYLPPSEITKLLVNRWFPGMNQICQFTGLSQKQIDALTDSVANYFLKGPQ